MLIFSIFFGRLAKMPSDGIPYPLFAFAALVPWTFFANAVTQSSGSLVADAPIIRKVYLPRMAIPMSAILSGLADLAIALLLLGCMMLFSGIALTAKALALPLFILLAIVTALGVGLWLSALNVEYRDVRYVIPFLIQCWMFATPVAYPSSLLSEPWRSIYALNPMVGVVEGFRWALLGSQTSPGLVLGVSALAAGAVAVGGVRYFRSVEQTFADVV
jgi:lipopolysaccharide transport system permease protein